MLESDAVESLYEKKYALLSFESRTMSTAVHSTHRKRLDVVGSKVSGVDPFPPGSIKIMSHVRTQGNYKHNAYNITFQDI